MGTLAISFVSSFVSVLFWRRKSRGLLIPESLKLRRASHCAGASHCASTSKREEQEARERETYLHKRVRVTVRVTFTKVGSGLSTGNFMSSLRF